ncbi:hypothetical protein HPB47_000570 [Ixodes persulcatus]|uniref:Uncharacterized protein n=1 Tax=Ixodes persulcatus TaxID=34615 RepID=A0AC60QZE0_IXOPE|nr:hypothetical protein HPB47_000570 [Ixodes persulcatus]
MEYLFSSTNCRKNYYIGSPSVVATVNKRLLSIRPPHCVTRLPRPVGDRSFWKASEWRQWLLFYCLPCTLGILDQRYWKHLRCLVEAVYILLLQEFTPGQLDHAEWALKPDSHGEILLAIFSRDVVRAAKAWTVAEEVDDGTENHRVESGITSR